jgi:5-formyltetrahydrofolate cyclo-ligase
MEMEIEKKRLRAGIRKELAKTLPETSAAIRSALQALESWRTARTVLTYHPLSTEVDLLPLLTEESTKEWVFPRVDGDGLTLHRWDHDACWCTGRFGIREPDPDFWPEADLESIDLALIPGLAFDGKGNRLGRGKGYYDRLLSRAGFRALRIGIVTERYLLREIPRETHDIVMNLVVTESSVHVAKGSGLDMGAERG